MKAITAYVVSRLGLSLTEACVEVSEVSINKSSVYSSGEESGQGVPIMGNAIVRYRVWVNEEAYNTGKQPVTEGQKIISFPENEIKTSMNIALSIAFPESTIETE